jgi:hypothetical protein
MVGFVLLIFTLIAFLLVFIFGFNVIKEKISTILPPETMCTDKCGDNFCQKIVCRGLNCPCKENTDNCPQDCREATNQKKEYPEINFNSIDKEWLKYQEMIKYIENRNMGNFNSVTYRKYNTEILSQRGYASEKNFWDSIENMPIYHKKKKDFSLLGKNEKQTIISTAPRTKKDGSYEKYKIFFIRNPENNKIDILSFDKTTASEKNKFTDSDRDGLTNREEKCEKNKEQTGSSCIKTDPYKRDTDKDGWWDGIEKQADTDPTDPENKLY